MIFITGATGFLGTALIGELIKQNKAIKAIYRTEESIAPILAHHPLINWVKADVLDIYSLLDHLAPGDMIYHCAAMVSFHPSRRSEMVHINVKGTENIVNAALEKRAGKLVHVSSIAALGRTKESWQVSEESEWQESPLNSYYAMSKYDAEMIVWRAMAEGLNAAIINPGVILGPISGNKGTGHLFRKVQEGLSFYPPGGSGFVGVSDVAKMMLLLMQRDIRNLRVISVAENISYKDLLQLIADGFGKKAPALEAGWLAAHGLAFIEKIKCRFTDAEPVVTRETIRTMQEHFIYQNQKSIELLDFKYTPIATIVKETCDYFRTIQP